MAQHWHLNPDTGTLCREDWKVKIKSLRYKINVAIFFTCMAVAVVFAAILYPIVISSHNTQLKNINFMLDAIFQQKKEDLANEVFAGQKIALELSLEDMLNVEGISAVGVWDKAGKLFASSGGKELMAVLSEPISERVQKMAPFPAVFEKKMLSKRSMAVYFTAIDLFGKRLGYFRIYYNLAELERKFRLSVGIIVVLLITMLAQDS